MTVHRTLAVGAALAVASTSCCAMDSSIDASNNSDGGIISLQLLNHHHVVERRRRELRAAGQAEHDLLDVDTRISHPQRSNNNLRSRQLQADGEHVQQQLGALYQGYGTHYIDLWVGYPAQRQTAVVDTGSSVTAFPCNGCDSCGQHTDQPFDTSASDSFRALSCPSSDGGPGCVFGKCDTSQSNGGNACIIEHYFGEPGTPDASGWKAYEAQDIAYAGGPHDRPIDGAEPPLNPQEDELNPVHAPEFSFPLTFGCQTSVSGYFEKQLASGVIGLDRRAQSFWGQMRASQTIHRAQFSLCFVKQPIASMSGSTAGAVTLGGVDRRLHKTPMVFAKSVGEGTTASFKVRLRKMYLREGNDQSVMFDAKQKYHTLELDEDMLNGNEMYNFDSGTTDTYFIKSVSDEFRTIWREVTNMEYTNDPIAVRKDSDLLKFPTVVLQLIPHPGGIGDEVKTGDPRVVPGLAGNVDMSTPNDVLLAIPPKHYMQRNAKDGTYTSRIYLDRDNALGNVLGANAMMGHDILFDMDDARIGFSESECDYAKLVASSGSATTTEKEADGSNSSGAAIMPASDGGDSYALCGSMKCRGFFGLTMALLFIGFFMFARRYINKRDGSSNRVTSADAGSYEMNSAQNLARGGSSADDYGGSDSGSIPGFGYSDNNLGGGERGGYRDKAPPSYSDHRSSGRRSDRDPDGRRDRSGSRESARSRQSQRRSSRDRSERHRSNSRDSGNDSDGGLRSTRSIHSSRSHNSGGSGGSGGSRETKRSTRSHRSHETRDTHRSSRTSGSRESNRTSRSKESHRTSGSRETHRSSRSKESHRSSGSRRHQESGRDPRDDEGRRSSSGNNSSRRFRDEYDDIPMPPSIA